MMRRRANWLVPAAIAVGLAAATGAWARATASEITACVEPRTGYMVLGRDCGGEKVTWGAAGPMGPQGPPGPQGTPGKGLEPRKPSEDEVTLRVAPPKALFAAPKANVPGNLVAKKAGGDAWSVFHDQAVPVPNILAPAFDKNAPWGIVAVHLDVPAGKYVAIAKAEVFRANPTADTEVSLGGGVRCWLVAGADFDTASGASWSTIALTVVHAFVKPGRIELRCTRWSIVPLSLENVKVTAIRVAGLKNAYVEAGPFLFG